MKSPSKPRALCAPASLLVAALLLSALGCASSPEEKGETVDRSAPAVTAAAQPATAAGEQATPPAGEKPAAPLAARLARALPARGPAGVKVANPAARHCVELGFTLKGEQCVFSDGSQCEHWAFYRGECGAKFSWCETHGGKLTVREEKVAGFVTQVAKCGFDDGRSCTEGKFFRHKVCGQAAPADPIPAPPSGAPVAAPAVADPALGLGACAQDSDCAPVGCSCSCSGCGGFSYEAVVHRDKVAEWYRARGCAAPAVCPTVCCPGGMSLACSEGRCSVVLSGAGVR